MKDVTLLKEDRTVPALQKALDHHTYAGIYYEGDTVRVVAARGMERLCDETVKQTFMSAGPDRSEIIVVPGPKTNASLPIYSMAELEEAKKTLLAKGERLGIVGVGFNGRENALGVYVRDYENITEKEKAYILEHTDVKKILFRDSSVLGFGDDQNKIKAGIDAGVLKAGLRADPPGVAIRGGDMLMNKDYVRHSTLATSGVYRKGKEGEVRGFITCGHGYNVGEAVYNGWLQLGTVKYRNESNRTDVAFIESQHTSNGYMSDGVQVTSSKAPAAGLEVVMYGGMSGKKSGEVVDTDISGTWKKIPFTGLFSTTCVTQDGDSGSAFVNGNCYMVGILKCTYFVKVKEELCGAGVSVSHLLADDDIQPCI